MDPHLVMCCTPLNREDYLAELRYAVLASEFFRYLYPNGRVSIGTTPGAAIPEEYSRFFDTLRYPFGDGPFAIQRQDFYRKTLIEVDHDRPIIFAGVDVLFTNRLDAKLDKADIVYSYRYHPAMPYCSDFLLVTPSGRRKAIAFQDEVIQIMNWQPPVIRSSWADQISIAAAIGHLNLGEFDGRYTKSPRRPEIDLVPGDTYLYTPNDAFFSDASKYTGFVVNDVQSNQEWLELFKNKIAVHFKGNRKRQFFFFSAIGYALGRIDPYKEEFSYPFDRLFDGFIKAPRSR